MRPKFRNAQNPLVSLPNEYISTGILRYRRQQHGAKNRRETCEHFAISATLEVNNDTILNKLLKDKSSQTTSYIHLRNIR